MNTAEAIPVRTRSIWWALVAAFWYWWDFNVPLVSFRREASAWWHGFYLRACLNDDRALDDDDGGPREAVSIDVSYWEE